MGVSWVQVSESEENKYGNLGAYGAIQVLQKTKFWIPTRQGAPTAFNEREGIAILLLKGNTSNEDIYLGNDYTQTDMTIARHTIAALSAKRLEEQGFEYLDLVRAGTKKLPERYRKLFENAIEKLVAKYFSGH